MSYHSIKLGSGFTIGAWRPSVLASLEESIPNGLVEMLPGILIVDPVVPVIAHLNSTLDDMGAVIRLFASDVGLDKILTKNL